MVEGLNCGEFGQVYHLAVHSLELFNMSSIDVMLTVDGTAVLKSTNHDVAKTQRIDGRRKTHDAMIWITEIRHITVTVNLWHTQKGSEVAGVHSLMTDTEKILMLQIVA